MNFQGGTEKVPLTIKPRPSGTIGLSLGWIQVSQYGVRLFRYKITHYVELQRRPRDGVGLEFVLITIYMSLLSSVLREVFRKCPCCSYCT